jgi:hypothetical protein
MRNFFGLIILESAVASFLAGPLQADQVVMQNGDVLNGNVESVTASVLVLKDENLGLVTLSRDKVTNITFGTPVAASPLPQMPANKQLPQPIALTNNSINGLSAEMRGIRDQTNMIQQVESQFLGAAGPDATAKFNELLDGLSTGQISINDLRQQAQSAADQLRELKKELGPDASGQVDSYLVILDNFLQETTPVNASTNSSSTAPASGSSTGQTGR